MGNKEVMAHLPGIFYTTPSPDEPPYKSIGDQVNEGDVVGLIEVMKSFHEVKADCSGKVVSFKVENEAAVVIGQALVEIEI